MHLRAPRGAKSGDLANPGEVNTDRDNHADYRAINQGKTVKTMGSDLRQRQGRVKNPRAISQPVGETGQICSARARRLID